MDENNSSKKYSSMQHFDDSLPTQFREKGFAPFLDSSFFAYWSNLNIQNNIEYMTK